MAAPRVENVHNQLELDLCAFFDGLEALLTFCEDRSTCSNAGDTEFCQEGINVAIYTLQYIETNLPPGGEPELLQNLHVLIECFVDLKMTWDTVRFTYSPSVPSHTWEAGLVCRTESPGRPQSYINADQILLLFQHGFKFSQIAEIYLMHRTTLWRRLRNSELNLTRYTEIEDEDLMAVIRNIQQQHPHAGVSMMIGHLRANGIIAKQRRIRSMLRNINPTNSAHRWGMVTFRRKYSVPGPNSLWHIDGHHKLIRWKLVTHGGIDGYSRLIVFLQCSNNNLSDTVLQAFLEAVENFSLPSRVRGDKGSENVSVAHYMEQSRGENRGSFISGRSVHNSRIERLWRDVFYSVIQKYYSLFYYLESQDMLNVESDTDLFSLHYVFKPRINNDLNEFKEAYNHHSMRSEHNWSPYQMWINGMISRDSNNYVSNDIMSEPELSTFGIDPSEACIESSDEEIQISYNDMSVNISERLITEVNPLSNSNSMGVDLYCKARDVISSFSVQNS